jgi:hypothetical protein
METMILVAGLAVAGLVGIAAAFYFSIRTHGSGSKGNSRDRSAGTGRARADRRQVSGAAPNDEWRENAAQDANFGETGNPGLISGPAPAQGARRSRPQARPAPQEVPTAAMPVFSAASAPEASLDDMPAEAWQDSAPDKAVQPLPPFAPAAPRPGRRAAARLARASAADDTDASPDKTTGARRRMGFRKGADIDEEMWPTESFGGVSDDQFWDDLASDKPLATTARTAQQGNRPVAAKPQADPRSSARPPASAPGGAQGGAWGNARRTGHAGAYPDPRPADRTAMQPVQAAVPPAPQATQPVPVAPQATQPVPQATQPVPMAPQQVPQATQPVPVAPGPGRQYSRPDSQPMRGAPQPIQAAQPSEANGRRYAAPGTGTTEDPLTSSAFALRSSGPVDGRSNQPSSGPHDIPRENYAPGFSDETQTFSPADNEAGNGGYPGGVPPFRQPPSSGNRAIEARPRPERPRPSGGWYRSSDAPAAETYGTDPADPYTGTAAYPYPGPPLGAPVPADEPRRPNVAGSHARQYGGNGHHVPRPVQNQNGGGHRRPTYDPRDDHRRLARR